MRRFAVIAVCLSFAWKGMAADPAQFGFDPAAEPATNAVALQRALDAGGLVRVAKPGTYRLDRTVYIGDDTELVFAKGTVLAKAAEYGRMLCNRDAGTGRTNVNITVRNLEIADCGINVRPDPNSTLKGLFGHVSFWQVKNLTLTGFRCTEFARGQYCLQVVGFDGFMIEDFVIRGGKDGIHLNAGRNFTIRRGRLRTLDDGIALNAGEWPYCTPEMGSVTDGLVEDVVDEAGGDCNFVRVITGAWIDWFPGMKLQRADIFRHNGSLYTVYPAPLDAPETASFHPPTHTKGVWKSPEGLNFLYLQPGDVMRADITNVVIRNCTVLEPKRKVNCMWEIGAWARVLHPQVPGEQYPKIDLRLENVVKNATGELVRCAADANLVFDKCRAADGRLAVLKRNAWQRTRCPIRTVSVDGGPVMRYDTDATSVVRAQETPEKTAGCLLLRFDDRNFDGWEEALPLFARYGAHATFFVYGQIDARAVSTLRKLQSAGHSLGAHGIRHMKSVDALKKMGDRAYFEAEIRPQLVAAEKAGVPFRHFAYPCSQRDAASDALLLSRFDRVVGGGFWPEARAGRIDRCDDLFVPAAEVAGRRVWIGSSVGACAPTVTGELARVIRRLADRGETALFYSHNIVSAERHAANDISFAELEFLLKTAREAGVRVCGLDELPFDGFRLSRARLFPGFDGKYCKIQPNVATDWKGTALLTYQRLLLSGSDVFYGQFIAKSSDGGRTWGEPKEIALFRDAQEDGCRVARYANVRYARKSDRWYALGRSQLYANDKVPLHGRVNGRPTGEALFATVDSDRAEVTSCSVLPFPFAYDGVLPFGDPVELADGDLIVPLYFNAEGAQTKEGAFSPPGKVVCVQYRFKGEGLEVVRAGTPIECPELKRGCGEPSLVRAGGRFYLTVRSDERGMFAESGDGLNFGELHTWCWEDGTPIGNRNTQQHWMALQNGLYLAYTREGALNDHVFRSRAPIFLARFDPARKCLLRATEIPLVPEYGARLGNFQTISDGRGESWLVTAEWMQPLGCEKYGSDNALWLVKLMK